MNWAVVIAGAVAFAALFTVMVFKTTGGTNTTQVENYPLEIQEEYFKTHERVPTEPLSARVVVKKALAIVVFALVLAAIACLAGARTFVEGFGVSFGLMVWIGCYDTFFLDWVLFANMPRFRLEGTEHMDRAYHQKWFHLRGMLFPGLVFGLAAGAIAGLVVMLVG